MDTYFFNYKDAYKEARKQNKFTMFNNLQICYYNGEQKETPYSNLIGLSIDDFCDYMSETPNRMVTNVVLDDTFTKEQKLQIEAYMKQLQHVAYLKKIEIGKQYREAIENQEPDFSEPLRILFITTRHTTVLQYIAKNLADAFNDLGYSTFISIEQNAMQSWGGNDSHGNAEFAWHLKNIYEYNPHIIFNLDWLNNTFLNDKVFNFIWFQDPMEILYNDEEIKLRDRDFIFSLNNGFRNDLLRKNVYSEYQHFLVNDKIFKPREEIHKFKKIVFIGSSYVSKLQEYRNDDNFTDIMNDTIKLFEQTSCSEYMMSWEDISQQINVKYNNPRCIGELNRYLTRDYCVEKLCQIDTDYEIEIYGRGWENNNIVKPYFKGVVDYGEDISKIYNSATYGYCPGAYILMQRTLECAFSETIPLVLDVRADKSDGDYDKRLENGIEFFHIRDLENILRNSSPENKDFSFIKEQYNFKHFINECLNIVNSELAINRK